MFEIQRGYIQVVQERGFRLPDRYLEFEPQVRALEQAMRVRAEATVPCNNDLLAENFIDVGGELRLIDYEYSGNNEPCFELGNIWSESNLSLEQLESSDRRLLRPSAPQQGRPRALWGLMSKYGWTLWGSIQDGISDLDFDFWGWAMEKYDRAVAEFDGPEFERLLADVQRRTRRLPGTSERAERAAARGDRDVAQALGALPRRRGLRRPALPPRHERVDRLDDEVEEHGRDHDERDQRVEKRAVEEVALVDREASVPRSRTSRRRRRGAA